MTDLERMTAYAAELASALRVAREWADGADHQGLIGVIDAALAKNPQEAALDDMVRNAEELGLHLVESDADRAKRAAGEIPAHIAAPAENLSEKGAVFQRGDVRHSQWRATQRTDALAEKYRAALNATRGEEHQGADLARVMQAEAIEWQALARTLEQELADEFATGFAMSAELERARETIRYAGMKLHEAFPGMDEVAPLEALARKVVARKAECFHSEGNDS